MDLCVLLLLCDIVKNMFVCLYFERDNYYVRLQFAIL